VQAFEKAAELKPGVGSILNNLGALRSEVGAFKGAVEVLERAIKIDAERPEYFLNLGNALRGDQRFAEAEQAYQRALTVGKGSPAALFNLGVLHLDNDLPGKDTIARYQTCLAYLRAYKEKLGESAPEGERLAEYMATAQKAIDSEEKRLERERRRADEKAKEEGEKARQAAEAQSGQGGAPTPAPGGDSGGLSQP